MPAKTDMRARVDAAWFNRQPQWWKDAYYRQTQAQVPILNRMFPTASRASPSSAAAPAQGRLLSDVERGATSPLGGQARPQSEVRKK
jgi:hypothetical protein